MKEALLDEHTLRDADSAMRETLSTLHNPARGEIEVPGRKFAEPSRPKDNDDRLRARGNVGPVVAGDLDFGIDVEGDVGESVGGKRLSRLPNRDAGDDVETLLTDGGEVVLGNVVHDSLKFED